MRRTILGVFALCSIFALPLTVGAHGAGAFYETIADGYVMDIGFSSPAPQEGESVIFDFQLRKEGTKLISGTDTPFTNAWVRIESETGTVFASGIYNAEFGGPRMSYMFPSAGVYTISVRYENGNTKLSEASFPMTVVPKATGPNFMTYLPYLCALGGVVLGALGMFGVTRLARKKKG